MSELKKMSLANRLAAAQKRQEAALQMTNANVAKRSARIAAEVNARRAMGIKYENMPGGINPYGMRVNEGTSPVSPEMPSGMGGRKRPYKHRRVTKKNKKSKKSKTRKH